MNNEENKPKKYFSEISWDNGKTWMPATPQDYYKKDFTGDVKEFIDETTYNKLSREEKELYTRND